MGYASWTAADKAAFWKDARNIFIFGDDTGDGNSGTDPSHDSVNDHGPDTHHHNLEHLHDDLHRIAELVELLRVGDEPDPSSGDTHPGNLKTVYEMTEDVHELLTAVDANVVAIRENLNAQ